MLRVAESARYALDPKPRPPPRPCLTGGFSTRALVAKGIGADSRTKYLYRNSGLDVVHTGGHLAPTAGGV